MKTDPSLFSIFPLFLGNANVVDMEDIKNIEIRPTISALLYVFNFFTNTILFSAIYKIAVISGFETRFTRVCNGWQRSAFHNKITLNCEILKINAALFLHKEE